MQTKNEPGVGVNAPIEILGRSEPTALLRAEIARVAPFDANVLVTGPSGSGKELVARSLHAQSSRSQQRFIPVDCASLLGELMASQLFGHVEGAFTGANFAALGFFRAADGGTIFLDEIGELELPLQARLLRTIQERVVTPVGSHEGVAIDVRIIAATNRDLQHEVAAGHFREDLFYRLNVVSIETLPLRDRRDDIPELAKCFLANMERHGMPRCTLSPGAIEALQDFDWPGNVRQLKNVLERAVITSDRPLLNLTLVQQLLPQASGNDDVSAECHAVEQESRRPEIKAPCWRTLAELERDYLLSTLETTYYNQCAASRLLGISRQALGRLMKRFEIEIPQLPGKPAPKK